MTVEKKALDYWILVNALTQDGLTDKLPKTNNPDNGDSHVTKLDDDPIGFMRTYVTGSGYEKTLKKFESSHKSFKREEARIGTVRLFVGRLERQRCIDCLSEKMLDGKKTEDPETDSIALFTLNLQMNEKKEPVFRSKLTEETNYIDAFAISPIIWALKVTVDGKIKAGVGLSHKQYEKDCADIQKKLVSRLTKSEGQEYSIEKKDIDWLYEELKLLYVDRVNTNLKNKIDVSKGVSAQGGDSVLLEFSVFGSANDLYKDDIGKPAGFQMDFYNEDLKWVYDNIDANKENLSESKRRQLSGYIRSIHDRSLRQKEDKGRRMNVLPLWTEIKDDDEKIKEYYSFLRKWFSIDKDPLGKWPASSKYSLATMQKLAINRSIGLGMDEFFSVNGPPGTGKTTLLKEIIADSIVRKAMVLSLGKEWESVLRGYVKGGTVLIRTPDDPDEYFDEDGCIKHDYSAVNDFSILVASSNNGAVENISKELPNSSKGIDLGKLDDEIKSLFEEDKEKQFFKKQADSLFGGESDCWGLVSVPLGNKDNVSNFRQKVLNHLEDEADEKTGIPDDEVFYLRKKEFILSLLDVLNLREGFRKQEVREEKLFSEATEYCRRRGIPLSSFMEECRKANEDLAYFCRKASIGKEEREKDDIVSSKIRTKVNYYQKRANRFSALFMHDKYVEWQKSIRWLKHLLDTFSLARYYGIVMDDNNSSMNFLFMNELVSTDENKSLNRHLYGPYEKNIPVIVRYNKSKQILFYRAMKLLEAFVTDSSVVRKNLGRLYNKIVFPKSDPQAGSLLTSLMLFVPVVSTTFASVNALSKRIGFTQYSGIDCFGKLIIDEAGQAVPSNALGAILRAKNTIVVGDPLQIEPVVTDDLKIIKTQIGNDEDLKLYVKQKDNDLEWSVQSCADLLNEVGTYNSGYGWVGSPLIIHRRCLDPMFSISNGLSYDGKMRSPETKDDSPYPPSCWIDVSGDNPPPSGHYNAGQEEPLAAALRELSRISKETGKDLDLFIISPFKDVGEHLDVWMKKSGFSDILVVKKEGAGKGNMKRIGTVHTFQGREADIVVFLLGCNRNMKGSIGWVNRNIINVAFTRAKKRIYVIGDWEAWSSYNSHIAKRKTLFEKLPRKTGIIEPC